MPKPGPRTIHRYGDAFKASAVRLSLQPGVRVSDVAQSLYIHPYMLSRWRRLAREGVIVTKGAPVDPSTAAELKALRKIKFSIDVAHPLAWHVVQEFGCVLNYLSVTERLPTVFMPVSPAPYLNGGPEEYLSWVIESKSPSFKPGTVADWLEGRLPRPVDDLSQWASADDA